MRGKKTNEVKREIEPELLDREDQAEYTAELALLRAEVQHIQAHASALNGMIRCEGRFMKPAQIRAEIQALREALEKIAARHEVRTEAARLCA